MRIFIILLLLQSCASPVFLSKKTSEFESYHDTYLKKWNRTQDYHIGFYKLDMVSKGVCVKGKDDESTEILVNEKRWFLSNPKERQVIINHLLNWCYYKTYSHSRNVYYL